MHAPIEGVYFVAKKTEDRLRIGVLRNQYYVENVTTNLFAAYLERIRNSMHEPIEGRSRCHPAATYSIKGITGKSVQQFVEGF
jgi:hypothetical protein